LPHAWSIEGDFDKEVTSGAGGGFLPCGTAWYKKHSPWIQIKKIKKYSFVSMVLI